MRRLSLLVAAIAALLTLPEGTGARGGAHRDETLLPMGCASCHVGHGVPGTGLLPNAEEEFCFECHGGRDRSAKSQRSGRLGVGVFPSDLEAVFKKPSSHPIWEKGRHGRGEAMSPNGLRHAECSDCHNHHKVDRFLYTPGSQRKRATLSQVQFEYEVCYRCHSANGGPSGNIEAQFSPGNRSYHPVETASRGSGQGLTGSWKADSLMACTDCHGNSDPNGPLGPHGSDYAPLLSKRYEQADGLESPDRYALCYDCHSRDSLLTDTLFPTHGLHVQKGGLSCSSCHSAHGSRFNRALIEFQRGPKVRPSSKGRLEFVSVVAGSGECYVNCHNVEHGPATY